MGSRGLSDAFLWAVNGPLYPIPRLTRPFTDYILLVMGCEPLKAVHTP